MHSHWRGITRMIPPAPPCIGAPWWGASSGLTRRPSWIQASPFSQTLGSGSANGQEAEDFLGREETSRGRLETELHQGLRGGLTVALWLEELLLALA
ncbi:hypothetical protein NDU88_003146 [Pleurodeles waltl]|uniref:Uncharacterized protein n=1 Tax=Pleurodeles waltl TaxID=8319 RepID=A0AAV7MD29_PLEWA|nr:hypothetical protein NDU88_003146 [Pleurodeles waltl]